MLNLQALGIEARRRRLDLFDLACRRIDIDQGGRDQKGRDREQDAITFIVGRGDVERRIGRQVELFRRPFAACMVIAPHFAGDVRQQRQDQAVLRLADAFDRLMGVGLEEQGRLKLCRIGQRLRQIEHQHGASLEDGAFGRGPVFLEAVDRLPIHIAIEVRRLRQRQFDGSVTDIEQLLAMEEVDAAIGVVHHVLAADIAQDGAAGADIGLGTAIDFDGLVE